MCVIIKFSVQRADGTPVVKAEIDIKDYSNNDIEVKWARLAMRYATQIKEELEIIDTKHIEDVVAHIAFSRDAYELDELIEGDGDWVEYGGYESAPSGNKMAIGFAMAVDTIDIIGGMATPAPVMATSIYRLLLEAREQVIVK